MAKASMSRLVPKVPKVPGVDAKAGKSRRAAYSASTKRALVDIAEELFTEQGYAATSLDAVVAGARVTKGALYHHFAGKQALFEAVFERVEEDAAKRIQRALRGHGDPWEKAREGLRAFLNVVQEPRYRRIVIADGPSVLGYERFREQEERSTFANVLEIVRSTLAAGSWDLDEEMLQTYARIFFGAMSSAGESVATSGDPVLAAQRVETAIGFLLSGVQSLVEAGVEFPDVSDRAADGDPVDG
ncbi:TetR/AcrR family transcriptional regulator [Nocardioides sambongensis]|uniref:TetR/AcrR family transcriptional regulator n=1 Tax=Nocardioides sambongensis TaxID=2589074 RepID=UPI00112778C7|nr:TetR/AcrR family transcriptional regulator [Nocardioides sambongensis]